MNPSSDTHCIFDIETNSKDREDVSTIHMITVKPYGKPCETFSDHLLTNVVGSLKQGLERLRGFPVRIGHNIIGYDDIVLENVGKIKYLKSSLPIDTLLISRYLNPDRELPPNYPYKSAPHSLNAWGYRLGRYKPEHEDWSVISDEMIHRNREDCEITELVYDHFIHGELLNHDWSLCTYIEHEVAKIITQQELAGVPFDVRAAIQLVNELESRIESIDSQLIPRLPWTCKPWGVSVSKPFKINGLLTKSCHDWFHDYQGDLRNLISGPFTRIEFIPFKLSSQPQVKEYLLSIGWKPTEYNYASGKRTSPKLTEDSFESLTGDIGELFKERFLCNHRLSQINGWLERVRHDGRLSARANTCGTNTGRFKHSNVVNVPKASSRVAYGKQMRALFTRSSDKTKLCGHDASGLELRMLANYINEEEFSKTICDGDKDLGTDIHTKTMIAANLLDRDVAKTFMYGGILYGAGDEKTGKIIGGTAAQGKAAKKKFFDEMPGLKKIIDSTKKQSSIGYLIGLDGRKVWMRKNEDGTILEHKALNTKLQSAGAIVMKVSMILLNQWNKDFKIKATKVLDMHDEAQADVILEHVDTYLYLAKESIVEAGKLLNLNLPLAADAVAGNNWAETH